MLLPLTKTGLGVVLRQIASKHLAIFLECRSNLLFNSPEIKIPNVEFLFVIRMCLLQGTTRLQLLLFLNRRVNSICIHLNN